MPRPRLFRRVGFKPTVRYFKPQGVSLRQLEVITLTAEELEALRLKDSCHLEQIKAATKMKTSQSTFQRILISARKKVTTALINGQAIRIEKLIK
jgi:uncharacterized protein